MGNTAVSSVDFQIDCNTFRPVCSNTLHFCQTSKPPVRSGVEQTNKASNRSLRHAVIWRKLSFGTQSANGSRFVETMLTVIETFRQQSRDILAYVTLCPVDETGAGNVMRSRHGDVGDMCEFRMACN